MVKVDNVRADTTVVPANVACPTDSSLLAKGVAKLTKTVVALHALGLARRTGFRDRSRSVRRRAHQIAAWLRRRSGDGARAHHRRAGPVVAQTRCRLQGQGPDGATRVVSLHDTDARPIRKGRLGKPVEFGYKGNRATANLKPLVTVSDQRGTSRITDATTAAVL